MKFKKSSLTIVFGLTSLFTCSLVFGDYGTAHIKIGSILVVALMNIGIPHL